MSETYTRHIHPLDLANRTIFGDGAAATIIEQSQDEQIFNFVLGTDGSGMQNLIVPNGGMKSPRDPNAVEITNCQRRCLFGQLLVYEWPRNIQFHHRSGTRWLLTRYLNAIK